MKKYIALAAAVSAVATPALAQEEAQPPVTVSGSVALVSDYRFRGVSQTDEEMAIQGGLTVSHASGLYAGTWASNLAGWGTFGGSSMEIDLYAGYARTIGAAKIDVGLTWYMYPGGADKTDFAEAYAKVSTTLGPLSLLGGVAYAPPQQALGNWSNTVQSKAGDKEDNLYLWGDAASGIPGTPFTLKSHIGYSSGNPGLGPNGTSVTPTGSYWDWSLGADLKAGPLTLGVSYVDTSIKFRDTAYLQPNFSSTKDGGTIAGAQVVFSVSAAF
jgi:uncharacterized protein (TIGR02001 family)